MCVLGAKSVVFCCLVFLEFFADLANISLPDLPGMDMSGAVVVAGGASVVSGGASVVAGGASVVAASVVVASVVAGGASVVVVVTAGQKSGLACVTSPCNCFDKDTTMKEYV